MIIHMVQKKYYLKQNTVLDGRYLIGEVIGEGGFGITYAGENTRTALKVAVKEFFVRDLMDRDTATSDWFELIDLEDADRFQKEKERFLKESRVLRDFSEENGVVHVLDYFETNGTAYIVMEYINGITLKDLVKKEGKMPDEDVFQKMKPLLKVLGKVHEAGLVHRDISPDNIMAAEDGTLCLIDFGAATRYNSGEKSFSVIGKTGYASPEQYRSAADTSPASDLYSLSASIYYCLTGIEPEDSLQRILVDEVIPAEQLSRTVPKKASDILAKGMQLKAEQRWQSAEEMLVAIDEAYPDKDTKEKRIRRRRIIAGIISAAVILLIAGGLFYYLRHRVEIKFRNIETEVIWLNGLDGVSTSDLKSSAETVKQRLEIFAGKDNYLWEETDEGIRVEFPVASLCGEDPLYACKGYLSRPMETYIVDTSSAEREVSSEEFLPYSLFVPRNGYSEITMEEEEDSSSDSGSVRNLKAILSDEYADAVNQRFGDILFQDHFYFRLAFDLEGESIYPHYAAECYSLGDGRSFLITDSDQKGNYIDVLYYSLLNETSKEAFGVLVSDIVNWEDPAESMIPGAYQVSSEEIADEYILFKFSFSHSSWEGQSARVNDFVAFKERLDALQKPYAFGRLEYDEDTYLVKAEPGAFSREELQILSSSDFDLMIGTFWDESEIRYTLAVDKMEVSEENDGFTLSFPLSDFDSELAKEKTEAAEREGVDKVFLFCDSSQLSYPVAWASAEDFVDPLEKGEAVFTEALFQEAQFAELLRTCYSNQFSGGSAQLEYALLCVGDKTIKPILLSWDDFSSNLKSMTSWKKEDSERLKKHAEDAGGELRSYQYNPLGFDAYIGFYNVNKEELAEKAITYAENFYEAFRKDIEDEQFVEIRIDFSMGEKSDLSAGFLVLSISKTSAGHKYVLTGSPFIADVALKDEINERAVQSDILLPLLERDENGHPYLY